MLVRTPAFMHFTYRQLRGMVSRCEIDLISYNEKGYGDSSIITATVRYESYDADNLLLFTEILPLSEVASE